MTSEQWGAFALVSKCFEFLVVGVVETFQLLLNSGAATEEKGNLGPSALAYAARTGDEDIVQLLVDHG